MLSWNSHLDYSAKSRMVINILRAKLRATSPKYLLMLYNAVLKPIACYGAIAWVDALPKSNFSSNLDPLSRLAAIVIIKCFKNVNSIAVHAFANVTPLCFDVGVSADSSYLRLCSPPRPCTLPREIFCHSVYFDCCRYVDK